MILCKKGTFDFLLYTFYLIEVISSFLTLVMGSIGVTPLRKNMGGRRRRSIDSNHKTIHEVSSKREERKWKSVSHEGWGILSRGEGGVIVEGGIVIAKLLPV